MPYKKRRFKKKPYRKKRKYRKAHVVRQPSLVADSQIVKLRYVDRFTLDPGFSTAPTHVLRASDLFDPNFTGTGHQPHGFDQWMMFYNHFQVLGSKITVNAFTDSDVTAANQTYMTCALKSDSTVDATDIDLIIEQKSAKYRPLTTVSGSKTYNRLTHNYSAKKFFNCDVRDRVDLQGDAANSPTENAFYHVAIQAAEPGDNPGAVDFMVVIDYIALLTERRPLAQS